MKILVILAHPDIEHSKVNNAMFKALESNQEIYVHQLYKRYPDFRIDIEEEQQLLKQFDRIVLQFPFFWYSVPSLLKKWMDEVLTYGWAYGPGGTGIQGKEFILAISTGGDQEGYRKNGYNWTTIGDYTKPIKATVKRCHAVLLPSFVIHDAARIPILELEIAVSQYASHLRQQYEVYV